MRAKKAHQAPLKEEWIMRGGLMAQHPMQTHYATRNANLSPFFTGSTGSILCSGFFIHRSPVLSSSGGEWTRVR